MSLKIYGSLLKNNPDVLKQSQIYPRINTNNLDFSNIPETFDGRDVWALYIIPADNQKSVSSWAIVARDILNDRYTLRAGGQIIFSLDYTEIVSCIDVDRNKYSIFDAWEYIYKYGLPETTCFSYKKMEELKLPTPDTLSYDEKIKKYGKHCDNIEGSDQTHCITKYKGKPLARRFFFSDAIFNIEEDTMEKQIMNIKYEIAKWGPVAAGFIIYENFLNDYNGLTVYEKVEGKPVGGHYVSILGWGKDYWICRNSWGTEWGLLGFFKIKMGIVECQLEQNISAISAYIYNFIPGVQTSTKSGILNRKDISIEDMKTINPTIYNIRKKLNINYELYYTEETIKLIKEGKLFGDLNPVILYPELLPNQKDFWVKDIGDYNFTDLIADKVLTYKKKSSISLYYIILIISCIIAFLVGYFYKKKK